MTAVLVVGVGVVVDATSLCSADASSTTKLSPSLMRGAAQWSTSSTAVVAQRLICRCRQAHLGNEVRSIDLTRCAAHLPVANAYFVDSSPVAREIPLPLLPLLPGIQHLQRRRRWLDAAVQGSKRLVCGVLNAETLPLSYQTTPQFIRTPSLHPLPPLTHTARVLPAGRW